MKKIGILVTVLATSSLFNMVSFAGSWEQQTTGEWKYLNDDGQYVTHNWIEGKDGDSYYLDELGTMKVGWFKANNDWYYASDNGSVLKNQWLSYQGDYYYLDSSGKMLTNSTQDGYGIDENGKRYSLTTYEVFENRDGGISIGSYIPEGEYYFYSSSKIFQSFAVNDFSFDTRNTPFLIKLNNGDIFDGIGRLVPRNQVTPDILQPGMFEVGKDIFEGTYILTQSESREGAPRYMIYNTLPSGADASAPENNIVEKGFINKEPVAVTLKNGQVILVANGQGNFVAP